MDDIEDEDLEPGEVAPAAADAAPQPPIQAGERLDRHLQRWRPDLSRARLQDLIRSGHALVNGSPSKPGLTLKGGETITLEVPEARPVEVVAQDIPLEILHEDGDLLVLNKPAGLVVHPAAGNPDGTLVNALLHHCGDLSGIGGELRPGIVHRLDKDTSGCIVVAKHDRSHRLLTEAFSLRAIRKTYLAVVEGRPKNSGGRLEGRIGRHPVDRKRMTLLYDGSGKEAVTDWEWLATREGASLVRCGLLTGRTHQIRVHMKEGLGCPILGDPIYGRGRRTGGRLMLHAWRLEFTHPLKFRPLSFEAELPPEFEPWWRAWRGEA
jgi:23S rRNA pseudouridine1911/1915/1917 synthase